MYIIKSRHIISFSKEIIVFNENKGHSHISKNIYALLRRFDIKKKEKVKKVIYLYIYIYILGETFTYIKKHQKFWGWQVKEK